MALIAQRGVSVDRSANAGESAGGSTPTALLSTRSMRQYTLDEFSGTDSPVCEVCGDAYDPVRDTQRFCSRQCSGIAHRKRITLECEWCGDEFEVRPCGSDRKYCGQACYAAWVATWPSERFGAYRNGVSLSLYRRVRASLDDEWWEGVARRVRERDGHECQMCGVPSGERNHPVHHIIPVLAGGTNADDLLMTLCVACHGKVEDYTRKFCDPSLLRPDDEFDEMFGDDLEAEEQRALETGDLPEADERVIADEADPPGTPPGDDGESDGGGGG